MRRFRERLALLIAPWLAGQPQEWRTPTLYFDPEPTVTYGPATYIHWKETA